MNKKLNNFNTTALLSLLVSIILGHVVNASEVSSNIDVGQRLDQFVLGDSSNNISLGIIKNSSPAKIYVCLVWKGKASGDQLWVAPPEFQRVEYLLYDSSGEAVPYLVTYRPNHKIYKKLSEVPKDIHNVREGLMWPPFTMPYEQVALGKIFKITHKGNYTLLAMGRLLKINDDSTLSLVELPKVSFTVHVSDDDIVKEVTH